MGTVVIKEFGFKMEVNFYMLYHNASIHVDENYFKLSDYVIVSPSVDWFIRFLMTCTPIRMSV